MIVIGVDVHKHSLTAVAVDELGRTLQEYAGSVDEGVCPASATRQDRVSGLAATTLTTTRVFEVEHASSSTRVSTPSSGSLDFDDLASGVGRWYGAEHSRVARVGAVIAHDDEHVLGNAPGRLCGLIAPVRRHVRLSESFAVDEDVAVTDLPGLARQGDHSLDKRFDRDPAHAFRRGRRFEDEDVAALGTTTEALNDQRVRGIRFAPADWACAVNGGFHGGRLTGVRRRVLAAPRDRQRHAQQREAECGVHALRVPDMEYDFTPHARRLADTAATLVEGHS